MKLRQKIEHTEQEDAAVPAFSGATHVPPATPTERGISDATVREMHFDDVSTSPRASSVWPALAVPSDWWPSPDAVVGT